MSRTSRPKIDTPGRAFPELLSVDERVLDVQPKLAARVQLLATGDINKNDPNDARSVAVAALRSQASARPGGTITPRCSGPA